MDQPFYTNYRKSSLLNRPEDNEFDFGAEGYG